MSIGLPQMIAAIFVKELELESVAIFERLITGAVTIASHVTPLGRSVSSMEAGSAKVGLGWSDFQPVVFLRLRNWGCKLS